MRRISSITRRRGESRSRRFFRGPVVRGRGAPRDGSGGARRVGCPGRPTAARTVPPMHPRASSAILFARKCTSRWSRAPRVPPTGVDTQFPSGARLGTRPRNTSSGQTLEVIVSADDSPARVPGVRPSRRCRQAVYVPHRAGPIGRRCMRRLLGGRGPSRRSTRLRHGHASVHG